MAERAQWEYQLYAVHPTRTFAELHEAFNELGLQGWEIMGLIEQDEGRTLILIRARGWG
jgi:hypothetical protein